MPHSLRLPRVVFFHAPRVREVRSKKLRKARGIKGALRTRTEREILEGLLPSGSVSEAMAGCVPAVFQGVSTIAKDSARRSKLMRIVDDVMAGWPKGA